MIERNFTTHQEQHNPIFIIGVNLDQKFHKSIYSNGHEKYGEVLRVMGQQENANAD